MDLRTLGHFVALIDHGSFAAAATAVNLSQSAFTRSIQNLERQAGHLLVDRNDKGLPPTSPGRLVLDYARPLLEHYQDLKQELDRFCAEEQGSLRLACAPALVGALVPQALAQLLGEHPALKVRYRQARGAALERALHSREIDLAVAEVGQLEADPRYRVVRLLPQRWSFYCRPGHPLAQAPVVEVGALLGYPLATALSLRELRRGLGTALRQREFVPAFECDSAQAALALALNSDAIGLLPHAGGAPQAAQGLQLLQVAGLPGTAEERQARYGVVSLRDYPLSPWAKSFVEILQELDLQAAQQALAGAALAV
ncbi:LysR substrate-binding domain-containing protein [Pseudomonas sp. NPDC007930]|uniref:LysR family transcriptional regulator n=1 Tax=Pseudomonas sp. NPDC007930 TaxID=3364417 RepID=UPI0036EDFC9D